MYPGLLSLLGQKPAAWREEVEPGYALALDGVDDGALWQDAAGTIPALPGDDIDRVDDVSEALVLDGDTPPSRVENGIAFAAGERLTLATLPAIAQPFSIGLSFVLPAPTATRGIVTGGAGAVNIRARYSAGAYTDFQVQVSGVNLRTTGAVPQAGVLYRLIAQIGGGTSRVYIDGYQRASGSLPATSITDGLIFGFAGVNDFAGGVLRRADIRTGVLSAGGRRRLDTWLGGGEDYAPPEPFTAEWIGDEATSGFWTRLIIFGEVPLEPLVPGDVQIVAGEVTDVEATGSPDTFLVSGTADLTADVELTLPGGVLEAASGAQNAASDTHVIPLDEEVLTPSVALDAAVPAPEGGNLVLSGTVTDPQEDAAPDPWNVSRLVINIDPDGTPVPPTAVDTWEEVTPGEWAFEVHWEGLSADSYIVRVTYTDGDGWTSAPKEKVLTVTDEYVAPLTNYTGPGALDWYFGFNLLHADYVGDLFELYRVSDGATLGVGHVDGYADEDAMLAFALDPATLAFSEVRYRTVYWQGDTGGVTDLQQTDAALMPTAVEVVTDPETEEESVSIIRDNGGFVGMSRGDRAAAYLDGTIPATGTNDSTVLALLEPTSDATTVRRYAFTLAVDSTKVPTGGVSVSVEETGIHRYEHGNGTARQNAYTQTAALSRGLYFYRADSPNAPSIRRGSNELGVDAAWTDFTSVPVTFLRWGSGTSGGGSAGNGFDGVLSFIGGATSNLAVSVEDDILAAMDPVYNVAISGARANAILPQNTQDEVNAGVWMAGLTQGDFTFTTGQSLSFDATGLTDEEVAETWWKMGAGYNGCQATHAFLSHPKFWVLEGRIEKNNNIYIAINRNNSPRGKVYGDDCAWIYGLQAPGLTNPYYQNRAVGLRALVRALVELILWGGKLYDDYWGRWEGMGKLLLACMPALEYCWDELPSEMQDTAVGLLDRVVDRLGQVPTTFGLVNKEAEGYEALLGLHALLTEKSGYAPVVSKLIPTADFWFSDVYQPAGFIPEGLGMDSYQGRSVYAIVMGIFKAAAAAVTSFGSRFAKVLKTKYRQHIVDTDGWVDAGSAVNSRVADGAVREQMEDRPWKILLGAWLFPEGKYGLDPVLGELLPSREDMITYINSRVADLNSTAHSESFATGGYAGSWYEPDNTTWETQSKHATMFAWPEQYAPEYPANLWTDLRTLVLADDSTIQLPMTRNVALNALEGETNRWLWFRRARPHRGGLGDGAGDGAARSRPVGVGPSRPRLVRHAPGRGARAPGADRAGRGAATPGGGKPGAHGAAGGGALVESGV